MTPSSPVRAALDELLRWHPGFDLVAIDWQLVKLGDYREHGGPWVLVELGQQSETFDQYPAWAVVAYAIWKRTGAIHDYDGSAVSDDPIWAPETVRGVAS